MKNNSKHFTVTDTVTNYLKISIDNTFILYTKYRIVTEKTANKLERITATFNYFSVYRFRKKEKKHTKSLTKNITVINLSKFPMKTWKINNSKGKKYKRRKNGISSIKMATQNKLKKNSGNNKFCQENNKCKRHCLKFKIFKRP